MLTIDPQRIRAELLSRSGPILAWLSALGLLVVIAVVPGTAEAQQVIMAPQIEVQFDQLEVSEDADQIEADFRLSERDWRWAGDLGLSLWLGLYSADGDDDWSLQRVASMESREGRLAYADPRRTEDDSVGVCVLAISQGGRLAPGMGYRCADLIELQSEGDRSGLRAQDATVSLVFERDLDKRAWFRSELGFGGPLVDAGEDEDEAAGEFFVHRAPSPPLAQREQRRAHDERGGDRYGQRRSIDRHRTHPFARRRDHRTRPFARRNADRVTPFSRHTDRRIPPHARYDSRFYGFGSGIAGFPRRVTPRRFRVDRFRQQRLDRRRIFGPLDVFDSTFDQDLFTDHPEDVFYQFRVPPGPFGRDPFGRPLDDGFESDE